jgi:hypothetical protein
MKRTDVHKMVKIYYLDICNVLKIFYLNLSSVSHIVGHTPIKICDKYWIERYESGAHKTFKI